MTVTTLDPGTVIGGIDTHLDTIHVAVIDSWGRALADREFPTTPHGYRHALAFLMGQGEVAALGIEGTSSYGAGITRCATRAGLEVCDVVRPERATAAAKSSDIEALRALHNARRSAVKARQAAQVQIRAMLATAPVTLREKYCGCTSSD